MSKSARTLSIDVAAPLAVFYLLHALGVPDVPALLASAVPPLVNAIVTAVRERRVEVIATAVLVVTLLSLVMSLLGSGGPRELLARGAWLTAPFGLWTLATASRRIARRPLTFVVTREMLSGKAATLDGLWDTEPRFRRAWRHITIAWGITALADSAARIVMAATLPVAWVPALDTALTVVTIVALQPVTLFFLWRSGCWVALFGPVRRSAPAAEQQPAAEQAAEDARAQ
jgi:hypothetical protein